MLLFRYKKVNDVMFDHDAGSVPLSMLLNRNKKFNEVMLDHEAGSVPLSPLPDSTI